MERAVSEEALSDHYNFACSVLAFDTVGLHVYNTEVVSRTAILQQRATRLNASILVNCSMGSEALTKYSSVQEQPKHIPMDRVDDANKEKMLENGRALIQWILTHNGYVGEVEVKLIPLELSEQHRSL